MSLLGKLAKSVKKIIKSPLVGAAVSAVNPQLGGALSAVSAASAMRTSILPGVGPVISGTVAAGGRMLPALGRTLGFGAGVMIAKGRNIARAAAALCVKHPQWCSTIGGVAAVAAMMESGQMPIPKRRRGRGLSPRDLRSFRRVARLIRVFAPTVRRIPHKALHVRGTGISHA